MTLQDLRDLITTHNEHVCRTYLRQHAGTYSVEAALKIAAAKGYSDLCRDLLEQVGYSGKADDHLVFGALDVAVATNKSDTALVLLREHCTEPLSQKAGFRAAVACGDLAVVVGVFEVCRSAFDDQTLLELIQTAQGDVGHFSDISNFLESQKLSIKLSMEIDDVASSDASVSAGGSDYLSL